MLHPSTVSGSGDATWIYRAPMWYPLPRSGEVIRLQRRQEWDARRRPSGANIASSSSMSRIVLRRKVLSPEVQKSLPPQKETEATKNVAPQLFAHLRDNSGRTSAAMGNTIMKERGTHKGKGKEKDSGKGKPNSEKARASFSRLQPPRTSGRNRRRKGSAAKDHHR